MRDLVVRNDAATVLIVEDLQWLDDASESFVAMLARVVTAMRDPNPLVNAVRPPEFTF